LIKYEITAHCRRFTQERYIDSKRIQKDIRITSRYFEANQKVYIPEYAIILVQIKKYARKLSQKKEVNNYGKE